jgi:SAM-dependent methyltransferase
MDPDGAWERNAEWWQREFTDGADPEYEDQIIPLARTWLDGCGRVVDVGTGEGQLARVAAARGSIVVGVDPTTAQVDVARERGGGPSYVRGLAEALPIATGAVDGVLACLVFEHLVDHERPIAEVARVLRPGGRFVFFLNHPLLQAPGSGWVVDHVLEEEYWRVGPYLPDSIQEETLAPGVELPFVHRPLHRYVNAMAAHGLLVEHMEEPAPPASFVARAPEYAGAATIPRLLLLVAAKIR